MSDHQTIDAYIGQLMPSMDEQTLDNFGPLEKWCLKASMLLCGMTELPQTDGGSGDRVSGQVICEKCGMKYIQHPNDWRIIGYGNVPFLNVLCDGRLVKL